MTVKEFLNQLFTFIMNGLRSVHVPGTTISLYYFTIGLFLTCVVIGLIKSVINVSIRGENND